MKTINIFALIMILAFVKTTKKMASYSDIVQSFSEISEPQDEGLAKLNQITDSFSESFNQLKNMESLVSSNCQRLQNEGETRVNAIKKSIEKLQEEVKILNTENTETQSNIEKNIKNQKEEVIKIQNAREDIIKAKDEVSKKEMELYETINVLHRLKNIAEDELSGTYKMETQMKNFTIVNNHGVSFIQRANLKEELKSVMRKTETEGKALISTLILMASNDDGHYSDPKTVQKILDVLDKIIKQNEEKKNNLQVQYLENTKEFRAIIDNSENLIQNLNESAIKDQFNVSNNNKTVNMYNRDIQFYQNHLQRRIATNKFRTEICSKNMNLVATNSQRYANSMQAIDQIKNQFA